MAKKLTKCEDCKAPLPMHLADLGIPFTHICSCTASYQVKDAKFVRAGNERNPVAEYDATQKTKKTRR